MIKRKTIVLGLVVLSVALGIGFYVNINSAYGYYAPWIVPPPPPSSGTVNVPWCFSVGVNGHGTWTLNLGAISDCYRHVRIRFHIEEATGYGGEFCFKNGTSPLYGGSTWGLQGDFWTPWMEINRDLGVTICLAGSNLTGICIDIDQYEWEAYTPSTPVVPD
jgi:hypothetical protein